jgi:hypothetical protein
MDFMGSRGIGSGMADQAADDLGLQQEYKRYATEAMASGEAPMEYEQWKAMMMQGQGQGQPAPTPAPSQGAIANPALMAQVLRQGQ